MLRSEGDGAARAKQKLDIACDSRFVHYIVREAEFGPLWYRLRTDPTPIPGDVADRVSGTKQDLAKAIFEGFGYDVMVAIEEGARQACEERARKADPFHSGPDRWRKAVEDQASRVTLWYSPDQAVLRAIAPQFLAFCEPSYRDALRELGEVALDATVDVPGLYRVSFCRVQTGWPFAVLRVK